MSEKIACQLLREMIADEGKAVEAYEKLREEALKIYRATVAQIDIEKDFERLEPLIKGMVKLDDIQDDEKQHKEKLKQIMNELKCSIE